MKILIAEDELYTQNALATTIEHLLGGAGVVETASNGNQAIDKALSMKPELVLMDVEMPLVNGLAAAAVIKRQVPGCHIVFLTAYDRFEYAVGALRAGGEEYLLKPISEAALREVLQRYFKWEEVKVPKSTEPFESLLDIWVSSHYRQDVTLDMAAESMGMSVFYFSRKVKAVKNQTFLEYFTQFRMEQAKKRLETTDLSVSDVGHAVGYADPNYFAKVFKKTSGMTPSTYRSQHFKSKNGQEF